jgi:hypothetical protein
MTKKSFLIVIFVVLFSLLRPPVAFSGSTGVTPPFQVGEKLVFAVKAFGITVGHSTLEIKEIIDFGDYQVYRIVVTAETTPFFSRFYRVRDRLQTYLDTEEFYSHRYEAHLEEGDYRKDEVIIYDQAKHIAYRKGEEFTIPPRVQDAISAYYYLRTLDLRANDTVKIPVNCGKHNYLLTLKVTGEVSIEIKDASQSAFILIPQSLVLEGAIKRKGEATAYLSVAEKVLLLATVSRSGLFSARAVLIEWKKS